MRSPGLPRLPVSRRRVDELAELVCAYNRIASEDLAEYKRRARKAEARVAELRRRIIVAEARTAELEQAIREHKQRITALKFDGYGFVQADLSLYAVLDGHDRQERDEGKPCYVCGSHWDTEQRIHVGGDRWLHADCQDRVERTSVNYRPERGYVSSEQPPTGKPPGEPPKGHGSDTTKTSAEVNPPSESGATRVHEPEPCRGLRWGYHDPRTCSRRNCPHPDPEEYEGGRIVRKEADVRHPRSGRWSRRERARDWLTGGSFKGVRRER